MICYTTHTVGVRGGDSDTTTSIFPFFLDIRMHSPCRKTLSYSFMLSQDCLCITQYAHHAPQKQPQTPMLAGLAVANKYANAQQIHANTRPLIIPSQSSSQSPPRRRGIGVAGFLKSSRIVFAIGLLPLSPPIVPCLFLFIIGLSASLPSVGPPASIS